jgi:hypothetical protein
MQNRSRIQVHDDGAEAAGSAFRSLTPLSSSANPFSRSAAEISALSFPRGLQLARHSSSSDAAARRAHPAPCSSKTRDRNQFTLSRQVPCDLADCTRRMEIDDVQAARRGIRWRGVSASPPVPCQARRC